MTFACAQAVVSLIASSVHNVKNLCAIVEATLNICPNAMFHKAVKQRLFAQKQD